MREAKSAAQSAHGEVRPFYRPDIDGLRAVAILSVVFFHVSGTLLPGGFIGVDIFFVISGFLISSLIFKELEQGGFQFGDFYARRVRRIFPALILMMVPLWVAGYFEFTHAEFSQLGEYIAAGGAFASNLLQWRMAGYFDTAADLKPLQHLWSLGIEEQFYILWPITAVLLWKRGLRGWIVAAIALSFAFNIWRTPHHATGAFFLPFGRAWELLLGSLLAYQQRLAGGFRLEERRLGPMSLADLAASLAAILLAGGLVLINSASAFPGWWALLPTVGAGLIIAAGEGAWINRRILAHPVMVFIGLISYPLYIWHWPLLVLERVLGNGEPSLAAKWAAAGAAVVLSILTYLLVERPLRRNRSARGWIVAGLCVAMAAISMLGYFSYRGWVESPGMAREAAAEAAAKTAWFRVSDCSGIVPKNSELFVDCRIWGDPTRKKTFVIWGDSHAHSWTAAAATIAQQRGAKLVEFWQPSCPPLLGVRRLVNPTSVQGDWRCATPAFAQDVLEHIRALAPAEIFLAARWTFYTYGNRTNGVITGNSFVTTDPVQTPTPETGIAALKEKLPETLRQLAAISKVVVIKTVPTLHSSIEVGLRRDPHGYEPSLAEYQALEAIPNSVIDQAARAIPGVSVLDPAPVLCRGGKCHAILNGTRVYGGDNNHLSDAGALLFVPTLSKLVPNNPPRR